MNLDVEQMNQIVRRECNHVLAELGHSGTPGYAVADFIANHIGESAHDAEEVITLQSQKALLDKFTREDWLFLIRIGDAMSARILDPRFVSSVLNALRVAFENVDIDIVRRVHTQLGDIYMKMAKARVDDAMVALKCITMATRFDLSSATILHNKLLPVVMDVIVLHEMAIAKEPDTI